MKLALVTLTLAMPSCISTVPLTLSGSYILPGGKGVVAISIPLRPALPQPQQTKEPEAELFPVNQK
jgi:hypothetical protein